MKHVEAERPSALLAAIFARNAVDQVAGFGSAGVPFARRLGAYRVHARASAARTLASTFPTVQAMSGNDNFQALAHGHLLEQPQREGDLGEWGAGLPGFIATQADLQAWPYLADCARLADTDTARLYLAFMPGTALITSNWPLHLIHQAHALPEGDAREALFAQVRTAIATPQANTMLVARDGWRAVVSAVPAHEVAWTQQLLAGASLDVALTDTGEAFDFSAWLANAVTAGRLQGICPRGD